jgi:hypothetical protein
MSRYAACTKKDSRSGAGKSDRVRDLNKLHIKRFRSPTRDGLDYPSAPAEASPVGRREVSHAGERHRSRRLEISWRCVSDQLAALVFRHTTAGVAAWRRPERRAQRARSDVRDEEAGRTEDRHAIPICHRSVSVG